MNVPSVVVAIASVVLLVPAVPLAQSGTSFTLNISF